jgi:hypothetical protein
MKFSQAVPGILWSGLIGTSLYFSRQLLQSPLWLVKQFLQFSAASVFISIILGFKQFQVIVETNDYSTVLGGIQRELDRQKVSVATTG